MLPSAGAFLPQRPVQRWRGNPVDTALLFHDGVMDDEDDRRLLDFIGDVQALNDYLHGPDSKSIEDDDLTNATFESSSSFFTSDVVGSEEGLKDVHNHLDDFGEDSGTGLHLSNSLQFIEDDLDGSISPSGDDLVGEDQPFDILQKSLLEADITEKTLAQEALLDTQPTLVSPNTNFSQQLVSGGLGSLSGTGVVAPIPLTGAEPQAFIQQVSQLPLSNGPAGQIQLVGSLNGSTHSMMTINSLDQPHILIRPGGNAVANNNGQGTTFTTSTPGQVSVPFSKGAIQLQNIIIQRGPVPQTLIRPIQPKAFQTGGQAVYNISNLGIQPNTTTITNPASNVYPANGSPQTSQHVKVVGQATSIVVHSPLGQQGQPQAHSSLPQGQFLIPTSSTVHGLQGVNGQMLQNNAQVSNPSLTSTTTYSILTNQNTAMQIIAGQNFAAGGQLIVNQGMVNAGQIGQASPTGVMQVPQRLGVTTKVWTATPSPTPTYVQTLQPQNRLTMVNSTQQPLPTHLQISVSPGQRLFVPVAQNTSNSSNIGVQDLQQQVLLNQKDSSTLPNQKGQTQLLNLLGIKASSNSESLRRPANHQLSREGMILEQLRYDHTSITSPDRTPFTSLNDIIDRLLPYHVFQGTPPCEEDFAKVDEEFETVASQVLQKTQSMVNKYRRLLMVEAERCSPSSETVMIDRTFNQEERNSLTQDRRLIMTDPDGFLEEFCCGPKKRTLNSGVTVSAEYKGVPDLMETSSSHDMQTEEEGERTVEFSKPACRTEMHPASEDPGGGKHGDTPIKISIDMKKIRSKYVTSSSNNTQHRQHFNPVSYATSPSHSQHSSEQLNPSEHIQSSDRNHGPLADTDSVLEAAVNSILDC